MNELLKKQEKPLDIVKDYKKMEEEFAKQLKGTQNKNQEQTKVWVAIGYENDNREINASEVFIKRVELSEKLRAKTQFGREQGSHILAWTFKINSLMRMLADKDVSVFLDHLAELTKRDTLGLEDPNLINKVEELYNEIENEKNKKYPYHKWILKTNELLAKYIELNQKLPTTTYKVHEKPKGHGKGQANKNSIRSVRKKN